MEIPVTEFDIDFHKYTKNLGDAENEMHIIIEKKYGYIGGGVSGSKKLLKKFDRIYKDIFRYYGVSKEDIENANSSFYDALEPVVLKYFEAIRKNQQLGKTV